MHRLQASLVLGMIAFTSGLAVEASRAESSCESPRHWETYIVERFGTRIEVPIDCFQPQSEIQDGWLFETADGKAKLAVYGSPNANDRDPRSLKRWLVEEVGGYDRVTYAPMGKTWLVLSGYRKDDIFYEKYILSDHGRILNSFWMTFPRSAKPVFSPLIERMEDSFRSGG